jgi:hypothetical protein
MESNHKSTCNEQTKRTKEGTLHFQEKEIVIRL